MAQGNASQPGGPKGPADDGKRLDFLSPRGPLHPECRRQLLHPNSLNDLYYIQGGRSGGRKVGTGLEVAGGLADDGKRLDFLSPRGPFYLSAGGSTSLNVTVILFMLFTRGGVRGGESRSG